MHKGVINMVEIICGTINTTCMNIAYVIVIAMVIGTVALIT